MTSHYQQYIPIVLLVLGITCLFIHEKKVQTARRERLRIQMHEVEVDQRKQHHLLQTLQSSLGAFQEDVVDVHKLNTEIVEYQNHVGLLSMSMTAVDKEVTFSYQLIWNSTKSFQYTQGQLRQCLDNVSSSTASLAENHRKLKELQTHKEKLQAGMYDLQLRLAQVSGRLEHKAEGRRTPKPSLSPVGEAHEEEDKASGSEPGKKRAKEEVSGIDDAAPTVPRRGAKKAVSKASREPKVLGSEEVVKHHEVDVDADNGGEREAHKPKKKSPSSPPLKRETRPREVVLDEEKKERDVAQLSEWLRARLVTNFGDSDGTVFEKLSNRGVQLSKGQIMILKSLLLEMKNRFPPAIASDENIDTLMADLMGSEKWVGYKESQKNYKRRDSKPQTKESSASDASHHENAPTGKPKKGWYGPAEYLSLVNKWRKLQHEEELSSVEGPNPDGHHHQNPQQDDDDHQPMDPSEIRKLRHKLFR